MKTLQQIETVMSHGRKVTKEQGMEKQELERTIRKKGTKCVLLQGNLKTFLDGTREVFGSILGSKTRSCFFSGSASLQVDAGNARVTCRKEGIHPKFCSEAKVYCNGEHVISVGGIQEKYIVDVWSGNHPFYQGNKTTLLLDADRVDKFKQRYRSLCGVNDIPILDKEEIIFEKKKKGKGKGGKK